MRNLIILIFTIVLISQSCKTDQADPVPKNVQMCDTLEVTYTNDIATIIEMNCSISNPICHQRPDHAKNIFLENYNDVKNEAMNSRFTCAINHSDNCTNMPFNADQLPQNDIAIIECWIENGFPQ